MVDVRSGFLLRRERNETHGGAQAEQCVGRVDIAVAVYVAQLGGSGDDDLDLCGIAAVNRCGGDGRFADGQSRYDTRAGDGRGLLVAAYPGQVLTVASSGAMMGWSVTVLPIMSVCVGSSNRMPVTRTRFGWTVTMQLAR